MKKIFKSKFGTILILIVTIALAGIAIFTAYRLYNLRRETVAPTAPTSKPAAVEPENITTTAPLATPVIKSCDLLTFNLATPTPTGTSTATPTETATTAAQAELPEAGTSLPTILGLGAGGILLLISFLLAL